jgi:hypothetical protein
MIKISSRMNDPITPHFRLDSNLAHYLLPSQPSIPPLFQAAESSSPIGSVLGALERRNAFPKNHDLIFEVSSHLANLFQNLSAVRLDRLRPRLHVS